MDRDQARTALIGLNLVIGVVFLLAPRLAMRLYGLDPDRHGVTAYPVRYLGARSLLFVALLADDDGAEALLKQFPVIAVTDAAANAFAVGTGEVPRRVALGGALTSALAVALALFARK